MGVEVAKEVFHLYYIGSHNRLKMRAKRNEWIDKLCDGLAPNAEVGRLACASSHRWCRELQQRGFRVKLIVGQIIKPYVRSNKNNTVDAEAICKR